MIPSGQTVEQYTLPNKNVKASTIRKPIVPMLTMLMNLSKEGTNCRNVTPFMICFDKVAAKSTKIKLVKTKNNNDTITLKTFRNFLLIPIRSLSF
jgi:hypothetical protein